MQKNNAYSSGNEYLNKDVATTFAGPKYVSKEKLVRNIQY